MVGLRRTHTCCCGVCGCCRRCFDRGCTTNYTKTRKVTQQQLEALYTGPDFLLDERVAQVLTTTFVCMVYATGLPMLIPIATLFFVALYWVDKTLFCRIYNTPPQFDSHLAERMGSLLPFAALIHLGFGMWMLGNDDIIPPNDALEQAAVGSVSSQADSSISVRVCAGLEGALMNHSP